MAIHDGERGHPDRAERLDAPALSRDDVFEVLSNCRRRYALYYLRGNDGATIGDLADTIAAWENEVEVSAVTSGERKRVYTSLQQVHLPKLADLDIVEYDDRSGTVRLGENSAVVDKHLALLDATDRPWSTVYMGLAAIYGTLLVGASAGAPGLSMLPNGYWAAFVALTLALTALAHRFDTQRADWFQLDDTTNPPE